MDGHVVGAALLLLHACGLIAARRWFQRLRAPEDRVLLGARIPVHVWLEGALPGPVVAREAILGAAVQGAVFSMPSDE